MILKITVKNDVFGVQKKWSKNGPKIWPKMGSFFDPLFFDNSRPMRGDLSKKVILRG